MLRKLRPEPSNLKILGFLNTRMGLSEDEKQNYLYLKKGYEGEIMFDSLTNKLQCECYILNDLLLKINNIFFQIDTLIIFQNKVNFCEVKNYEGDFFYEKEKLYTKSRSEIKDPILQVKRSESLLRQFFQSHGFHNIPIEGYGSFHQPFLKI